MARQAKDRQGHAHIRALHQRSPNLLQLSRFDAAIMKAREAAAIGEDRSPTGSSRVHLGASCSSRCNLALALQQLIVIELRHAVDVGRVDSDDQDLNTGVRSV